MAVDKLVDSTKLNACLDAEADAIRAKTGDTSDILFDFANDKGFADAIAAIPSGGGVSYFEFSPTGDYQGQNPYDAFMLILNAVRAIKGDVPFYAWTPPVRGYIFQGVMYYPASLTQQKDSGVGWYAVVQRAEYINSVSHVLGFLISGFDPVETTTTSVIKFPTSGRSASIRQADVYRAVDLSDIMLMSVPANATNLATPEETRLFATTMKEPPTEAEALTRYASTLTGADDPDVTPALFTKVALPGEIPVWKRPTGAHDAYDKGDKVYYPTKDDDIYMSIYDGKNSWSPDEYPQGWEKVS